MDERPQQARSGELFQVRARLAEPPPDALGRADPEASPDKAVQADVAGDDVPAGFRPREVDLVEHLGLDEGHLVAAPGTAERAAPGCVAVAFKAASSHSGDILDGDESGFRLRRDQDRGHRAFRSDGARRPIRGEVEIERREHPARLDLRVLAVGLAGIEPWPGRRAEHDDRVVSVGGAHACQPLARPREPGRVLDRDEPEISLAEPLLEEEQRLALGRRRRAAEHLGDASAKFLVEHALILRCRSI